MNYNRHLLILSFFSALFITLSQSIAQEHNKKKLTLEELHITNYPSRSELNEITLPVEKYLKVSSLNSDDIDSTFSNINDLFWLEPIAKQYKVIMVGEDHYYKYIQNLKNRILFALNTFDYFPYYIFEAEYSLTPYLDYYLFIKDDLEAEKYVEGIHDFIGDQSTMNLLNHIRRWNKQHPNKPIHIAFSDIEHNYRRTFRSILKPYFSKIDTSVTSWDIDRYPDLESFFPSMDSLIVTAKKQNAVGKYPFETPEFIETVLINLKSLFYSSSYSGMYYRQKAIVRNLTDARFLGNYLTQHKVLLHGGSNHMPTHFIFPANANFLREGCYLTHDFEPTRGKTFSITVNGGAFSLGDMKDINFLSIIRQGSGYMGLIYYLQTAYENELISADDYYFVDEQVNDFKKLLLKEAMKFDNCPLLIDHIDWDELISAADRHGLNKKEFQQQKSIMEKYDINIFVPKSPVMVARTRNKVNN